MKKLLATLFVCFGVGNVALMFAVLNTCMAVLQKNLHASTLELQWILNVYGIFIAPCLVIAGRLADKFGYKRIFCLGVFFLVISTFGTAFSQSADWVIFFQIFFGLSGAILLPVSQVLMVKIYGPSEESRAMALWTAAMGTTLAFGPIFAGFFIDLGTWRTPFIILAIISLISFIGSLFVIPEFERPKPPRIDVRGTILLMATIACFVLAVMQSGTWRLSLVVGLYVVSIILLIFLLVAEKNVRDPIIQEYLFKNRTFVCASLANGLLIFFVWSYMFLIPLFLQSQLGYSILQTGLIMLTLTAPLVLLSNNTGKLYDKFGPKKLIVTGSILLIITVILGLQMSAQTSIWFIAIPNILFGLGWAVIMVPAVTAAMGSLDQHNKGAGSGTFNTFQEIGGVVGLTIIVTVVRLHENFITGLHEGFYTLLIFVIIALIAGLTMKRTA